MTPSIIKHDRVRIDGADTACAGPSAAALTDAARPRTASGVRLLERDGRVHAIELVCACGEVSVVQLDYDAAPQAANTQSPPRAEEKR